jgi:inorganic triphosphatase YgiF
MSLAKLTEIEVKLLITAQDPVVFLKGIARKSAVLNFQLIKHGRRHIRDIYLDTSAFKLKNQRLALRLRKQNSQYFLTLKGKTKIRDWGGVERLEVELPWSASSIQKMQKILRENHAVLNLTDDLKNLRDPLEYLKQAGLKVIQDRETHRLIRAVLHPEDPGNILVELALDTVTFRLKGLIILQAEIELEAKSAEGLEPVRQIREHFLQRYPQQLRSWTISKLSTGLMIEQLQQEGILKQFLSNQNYLLPQAYDYLTEKFTNVQD